MSISSELDDGMIIRADRVMIGIVIMRAIQFRNILISVKAN